MQIQAQNTPAHERTFLPAAGSDWLLPLYDPFVKLFGGDALRKKLIQQANIQPGNRVLEIGCGTGSLLIAIQQSQPEADLTGLDPDPKALKRAEQKARRNSISIHIDQGFADQLPYPDGSFDRVLSSFMFHHLNREDRENTLQEAQRVLKPGGSFHMVDFENVESGSKLARFFHSSDHLKDNSVARILTLLEQAGFKNSISTGKARRLFFPVAYYKAFR